MPADTYLIYLLAIIGLSLSPGPNGLLALTHGVLYGHRKAVHTISGGVVGFVLLVALAMLGIGAILETSAGLLYWLRWAGGLYLIWLGIQVWRSPPMALDGQGDAPVSGGWNRFQQGFLSALSNPKVILFFGAFFPQFIDPARDLLPQFLIMAGTFAVVEFTVEYLLARSSHLFRPWLQRNGKAFNRGCGGLFMAIGASLPLAR
ncbi:MAG: LysE family translocator [Gammaproteobacteria bacterium]